MGKYRITAVNPDLKAIQLWFLIHGYDEAELNRLIQFSDWAVGYIKERTGDSKWYLRFLVNYLEERHGRHQESRH